ncbi:hypothetical protein [Kiloniella majae]|uniref:hypothetical protein n=1 Tax=Kiloniella majae TaxID=1938558 RepID=UPI000A2795A8|nr:hypothetical protein [Kiloniella majae]
MAKTTKLSGTLKVLKWDEQDIKNNMSPVRVKYEFQSTEEDTRQSFIGDACYSFFYKVRSPENPLASHTLYSGFLSLSVELDGCASLLTFKDIGEFKDGTAISNLTSIENDQYRAHGSYTASPSKSEFTLVIEPI